MQLSTLCSKISRINGYFDIRPPFIPICIGGHHNPDENDPQNHQHQE